MTDELLNPNNDDLVSSPAMQIVTPLPTEATVTNSCDKDDDDYQSETEREKPVLLELGTSSNVPLTAVGVYSTDMHLSNLPSYINSQTYLPTTESSFAPSYLNAQLFSNPYVASSSAVGSVLRNAYPSHIPQTVCNWSNPENLDARVIAEIVPSPMYISYPGAQALSIVKEANPSWKEKALQIEKGEQESDYKKTACDRERTRMRDMNRAFDLLRSKLPISKPNGKKYSKIESLRIAIQYIHYLQNCLKSDNFEPTSFLLSSKPSSRSSGSDFISEGNIRRQFYQFASDSKDIYDEGEREQDKTHNGAWSESNYIPQGQDQWD